MKTKLLLILISIAFLSSATTITKVKTITPRNLDACSFSYWNNNNSLTNITLSSLKSGYEKLYGTDYYRHRGYLEFNLQNLGIEKYATITGALINLKADFPLETAVYSTVKDTINLKTIVGGVLSNYLFPTVWNSLNSGLTLSSFEISRQETKVVSNPTMKDYVNSRIGDYVGFALINQREESKGMSFYKGTNDLYLRINYSIQSPETPKNLSTLTSSISKTGCTLSWEDGGRSDSYTIYVNGSKYDSELTSCTYTISGLSAGTIYNFNVSAVNEAGESTSALTSVCTLPNNPISPLCYSISEGQILTNWTATTGVVNGYRVYLCAGTNSSDFQTSQTTGTTATINALTPVQPFIVKVCSYNASGESNRVIATPASLIAPTNFRVWSPVTGVYILMWDYSGTEHLKFRIVNRSTGGTVAILNKDIRTYTLTGLTPNTVYMLGLDAFNMVTRSYSPTVGFQTGSTILRSTDIDNYQESNDNKNIDVFNDISNTLLFIKGLTSMYNIDIYNIQGKKIASENNCDNVLDISNFESGLYILKIKCGTNEITKKFLKK